MRTITTILILLVCAWAPGSEYDETEARYQALEQAADDAQQQIDRLEEQIQAEILEHGEVTTVAKRLQADLRRQHAQQHARQTTLEVLRQRLQELGAEVVLARNDEVVDSSAAADDQAAADESPSPVELSTLAQEVQGLDRQIEQLRDRRHELAERLQERTYEHLLAWWRRRGTDPLDDRAPAGTDPVMRELYRERIRQINRMLASLGDAVEDGAGSAAANVTRRFMRDDRHLVYCELTRMDPEDWPMDLLLQLEMTQ